jgi:hypothetical protein
LAEEKTVSLLTDGEVLQLMSIALWSVETIIVSSVGVNQETDRSLEI